MLHGEQREFMKTDSKKPIPWSGNTHLDSVNPNGVKWSVGLVEFVFNLFHVEFSLLFILTNIFISQSITITTHSGDLTVWYYRNRYISNSNVTNNWINDIINQWMVHAWKYDWNTDWKWSPSYPLLDQITAIIVHGQSKLHQSHHTIQCWVLMNFLQVSDIQTKTFRSILNRLKGLKFFLVELRLQTIIVLCDQ